MPPTFILASRSPRRVAYLREAGYAFDCCPADVPEVPGIGEPAADYALRVAHAKAQAALLLHPALMALGADTDVVRDGRILGKPRDADDATAMLMSLSGRTHQVISAVVLLCPTRRESALTITEIDFTPFTEAEAHAYVRTGEPDGKAGAYGIQGAAARFVRAVRGSYTGVVGLPMAETCTLLTRFGIHPVHP